MICTCVSHAAVYAACVGDSVYCGFTTRASFARLPSNAAVPAEIGNGNGNAVGNT